MGQEHSGEQHINSLNAGWTPEREWRLAELWIKGLSCAQIARDLKGITRNAVIGKVQRLGLPGRETPSKPATLRAPPVKRAPNQNAGLAFRGAKLRPDNLLAVNAERRASSDDPGLRVPASAPLPGSTPRPWTTRTSRECAWPVGDGEGPELHHCCNPVAARGWCEVYFARGTQSAKAAKPPGPAKEGATKARRRWAA